MARYIVFGLDGDPGTVCISTTPNNTDMGPFVFSVVGEGFPFFAFETLPNVILLADEIGANFNTAPLCSTDYQTNRNSVTALYADPPPTGALNDTVNMVWKVA